MRDFFKGWKRTVGIVTLWLACVLSVWWVRSRDTYDELQLNTNPWRYSLASGVGQLHLFRMSHLEGRPVFDGLLSTRMKAVAGFLVDQNGTPRYEPMIDGLVEWRWDWVGFHLSEGTDEGIKMYVVSAPYWSIVIPLTLLSAWLLLSKPRLPAPKQPAELAPTTGT